MEGARGACHWRTRSSWWLSTTIDTALYSHQDGDSEGACRRATATLTALPDAYRTGLVHRRGKDLLHAIPAHQHAESAVRELRDALAT